MSLKAIASVLGLSVTTVSRALNGYEYVSQETRKRVEAEAERRGYRPNAAARRLKTGRANAVGLVFPASTSPISDCRFSEMLLTLDQRLAQQDIDLLLLTDKLHDNQRTLTRLMRSRVLDALIVTHTAPQDDRLLCLQQKNFRFITLGRSDLPQPYAWLDVDHQQGSRLAVEACLQQGMTRIAWLGSDEATTFVRDRRQGFLDAMAAVASRWLSAERQRGWRRICHLRRSSPTVAHWQKVPRWQYSRQSAFMARRRCTCMPGKGYRVKRSSMRRSRLFARRHSAKPAISWLICWCNC